MSKAQRLPPLQTLVFFEAAARHLNFTAAAQELATTQPAVSQRIAMLEADLGVPLFKRGHRGVQLTADGVHLFEAVHASLGGIGEAVARIRERQADQVLTVGTDFGFAAYWLMPRLAALRADWPELDVRIVTSQNEIDVRGDAMDMAIAFGSGRWPGCEAQALFPELVLPVCSPAFLARHPRIGDNPQALLKLPLLHLESPEPARWLTWRDWFTAQGLSLKDERHGLTLNNHTLVLQAAMTGQGVALAWRPLVDELLKGGQLVVACDRPLRTERGYFLVQPGAQRPSATLRRFKAWIEQACLEAAP
ncbi:LysR substrate-binding domain-containing protein [Aquabacterium sp.]|jgi:putative choline sulfate-utilization transcription factor|uniref:choline sulfate utilization transcriptional regulator n=1 Tax=Aquabacterium sp. TaxID=1872578 RepID=UPI0025C4B5C9|nr:LysR substrate-binding domain-containing protein [Aquabacterium sp.]